MPRVRVQSSRQGCAPARRGRWRRPPRGAPRRRRASTAAPRGPGSSATPPPGRAAGRPPARDASTGIHCWADGRSERTRPCPPVAGAAHSYVDRHSLIGNVNVRSNRNKRPPDQACYAHRGRGGAERHDSSPGNSRNPQATVHPTADPRMAECSFCSRERTCVTRCVAWSPRSFRSQTCGNINLPSCHRNNETMLLQNPERPMPCALQRSVTSLSRE